MDAMESFRFLRWQTVVVHFLVYALSSYCGGYKYKSCKKVCGKFKEQDNVRGKIMSNPGSGR